MRRARGKPLRLEFAFPRGPQMRFNTYYCSWSADGWSWRPIHWEKGFERTQGTADPDALLFEPFESDTVQVGPQVPQSRGLLESALRAWRCSPHARLSCLGRSIGGRPLWRLSVTERGDGPPPRERSAHYFAHQHPLEYNARWRMAGMIDGE